MRFLVVPLIALVLTQTAVRTPVDTAGTRLAGVDIGLPPVGFEVKVDSLDSGAKIGLAIWYPARAEGQPRLTSLDYRMLAFGDAASPELRAKHAEQEAAVIMKSPHVGIVPQTREQALAGLSSSGVAARNAPRAPGRYPLVLILGGPYSLSTTAEVLASHGFVVCAPFRFSAPENGLSTDDFIIYMENSVRDAERASQALRAAPWTDVTRTVVLGHGGGGLQALLFAMRNPVAGIVNVDAGSFSTRTEAHRLPSYSPKQVRSPFLYIATADTRRGQDLFDDFLGMSSSDRYEVTLGAAALRHHDLSDLGRAVTEPLRIRGDAQSEVQAGYAAVQRMVAQFAAAVTGDARNDVRRMGEVLQRNVSASAPYTVTVHPKSPATGAQ